jgi:hypothetical protein
MRTEKEQNPKSFAGTFWVSYFQLNENEVFVRACGRARSTDALATNRNSAFSTVCAGKQCQVVPAGRHFLNGGRRERFRFRYLIGVDLIIHIRKIHRISHIHGFQRTEMPCVVMRRNYKIIGFHGSVVATRGNF